MSGSLRIVLILASIFLIVWVMRGIKKSKMRIEDSLFWVFLALLILILSVFPEIASTLSTFLGFEAPVNFIFLFFIFVLLMKCFYTSIHTSQLETKVRELTEQIAINQLGHYEREQNRDSENNPQK